MQKSVTIFLIALGFILASSTANALDYRDWVPLLPESIGGLDKQGDPEGMNMEKGAQSWATLKQPYADEKGNELRLSLVTGTDAPVMKEFETLQKFNMETAEKAVKTTEISGHKAVLNRSKTGGKSNLMIAAQKNTLVIIETDSFESEKELVSLAEEIPLGDIADSIE
ncbi:MAG: DUF4367 domain-containing protein [Thermodesulfobacteriota bacterium]